MSYDDDYDNPMRIAIVNIALMEALQGDVHAHKSRETDSDGKKLRWGWEKLLKYFSVSAPGVWTDDVIKQWTAGNVEPAWCGVFALWAIKVAGMQTGTWHMSLGISAVSGFQVTNKPKAGDVGFITAKQHHVIIHRVWDWENGGRIQTIEGNSGSDSEFTFSNTYSRNRFAGFYTIFKEEADPRSRYKCTFT